MSSGPASPPSPRASFSAPPLDPHAYPRFLRARVAEALTDTPVVLLQGPRQCGKTTLARQLCEPLGYGYASFDDDALRAAALTDPVGIEIKAAATVTAADFKGLRKLQDAIGACFRKGVVLYDGERVLPFGPALYAVPLRALWEMNGEINEK